MATSAASIVEEASEPAPAKKPTRVAQISARIKSVAALSDRVRSETRQKRPAPVLPPEAKRGNEKSSELNKYATGKARGEPTNFLDLVRSLGELRAVGEKGHKQLLANILPRLAQHELPPASLVPQLIQLAAASEDRRLVRFVYYLLQLLLGTGAAGTPSPAAGETTPAVVSLPADISSRAWAGVLQPETPPLLTDLQLRTLSAAGRALEGGRLDKTLAEAVQAVIDRAEAAAGLGAGKKSKAQRREAADAWELHGSAVAAARNALQGRPLSKLAVRSSLGIVSPDLAGARHSLAMLTFAMRENAAAVFKEDKDLSGLVAATATAYESSSLVLGADRILPPETRRTINIADKWGRMELARVCAAAVYADWTSTQDFVNRVGAPFWKLLGLLATRDRENLVALEAIRSMFGGVHFVRRAQTAATAAAEEAWNVKLRLRAWALFSAYADKPVGYEKGTQSDQNDSLASAIELRLLDCLSASSSVPLKCSACRVAGNLLEAAIRAQSRSSKAAKESGVLQTLLRNVTKQVRAVAQGDGPPAVRCTAFEALLWTQAGSQQPVIQPAGISRCISRGGWSKDMLQALFERIYQLLRMTPAAAGVLLQIAGAIASSAASAVEPDQLLELWSVALKLPNGKLVALSAALSLLSTSTPSNSPPAKGASPKALARSAANEAGWLQLLRNAAWWLGENANLACNEFAGSLPPPEAQNENEAPEASTTPLETAALQAFRNPKMAAVISHLQHAALTQPSGPRTAAVQALAKVAVRSEEPYRLQCYAILASLDASHHSSTPDVHGVACAVQPVLPILDMLYSTRLVLEKLAVEFGRMPQKWPPTVVAQLRQRNNLLEQRIQRVICSLSTASYFILGPLSRDLLTSGIDSLAPQPSLPRPNLQDLKTAVSLSSQDTMQSPAGTTARHSRNNSLISDGVNPLLSGPDPLAALTDNLNQHITAEAFKPRAPAPWELNALQPPSTIPEESAFGFGDRDLPDTPVSRRTISQDFGAQESMQYVRERGVAIHAFDAEMSDELSIRNGEEVDIEGEVDGWLHCINQYGIKGLVPASYVRILGADEASTDVAAQLFGGFGARQHQRQKSVDLLNQPDMLSAFLGPSQTDDDWGASSNVYQTHNRDISFHDDDFGTAPLGGENMDGNMAIPEPAPYNEPETEDEPETPGREFEQTGSSAEETTSIPTAPDNPFESEPETSSGVQVDFEAPEAATEKLKPSVSFKDPEAAPEPQEPQNLPQPLPPPAAIAIARLESAKSVPQPMSARIEHEPESASVAGASAEDLQPGMSTGFSEFARQPSSAAEPALRSLRSSSSLRHSRQLSRDLPPSAISRQASGSEAGQPWHTRQASYESLGTETGVSPSQKNTSLTAIRGSVLYEFVAETDDELTVAPGDSLIIQAEVDGWYQVTRTSDGRRGLIPASYASTQA